MKKAKVNRTAYHRLRQAELSVFAKTVVSNTFEEAAYADVQTFVTAFKAKSETYETALQLAANYGREEMAAKNKARRELLAALKSLADAIDCFAQGDETYVVNAGFELQNKPEALAGELLTPTDLVARSIGVPGQLQVSCKVPQRSLVRLTALEWSVDNVNWNNGTYSSASRFTVKGLPSLTKIYVRVCALGTSKRKSEWTEPVLATVL